jgi:hypothetical protein
MQKKNLIFVFILALAASLVFYPQLFAQTEGMGISAFTNDLNSYVDQEVTLAGIVSEVYDDENLILLTDEGGCCNVPVLAPFTAEQQELAGVSKQYSGTLPSPGDKVLANGTLRFDGQYFLFDLSTMKKGRKVIIKQAK